MSTYSRSASANPAKSLTETALPPRTLARVAREVRDLMKHAPEGTKLIVDPDTGLPPSLSEIVVSRLLFNRLRRRRFEMAIVVVVVVVEKFFGKCCVLRALLK